ncbi:secreted phage protein [Streptococcus pseudoporcinus]|uniref:Secreted phage protein n=2 Tax=Streptococcus pseudoporcinus TaxID=361101 RepID=A0A4U9Z832_9STRE|nr:secreted phage protein [Streptococcus pseudoporcinus]
MLAVVLLTVGLAPNVKAEIYGNQRIWGVRTNWEQGRDFGARPIKKGDNDIKVKTAPEAVLTVKKWENNKWTNIPQKKNTTLNNTEIQKTFSVANGAGLAVFYLSDEHKPQIGDKYKLTLTIGGFYLASGEWTVGESFPKDVEEKDEAEIQEFINKLEEKERVVEEQKHAEELFKLSIDEESKQPWHKRLGDSIQGQWADFTGWLKS